MITSRRLIRGSTLQVALLGTVVTLSTLGLASPANAQGAWCAQYGGPAGGTNCGFYTYQQCRAAVSGIGGFCSPSPYARFGNGGEPQPRRKVRRQYRY